MPAKILKIVALVAAAVSLLGGQLLMAPGASAAGDTTVTAVIKEHPDNGHGTPAHWATDSFTRTLRIHQTAPGTYTLLTTDSGTFTTIKGAGDPAGKGKTISRIVTGRFSSAGTGHATGTLIADPGSLSGQVYDDVHGTAFPGSGSWADQFFKSGASVSPFDSYAFSYTTSDERWLDASTNNDGQDSTAGDITGKLSSMLLIGKCHAKNTTTWKVMNVQGDRSRTFTWWSYYHGKKSAAHHATVNASSSVTLRTATSTTLGIHYYTGYNVSKWLWEHCGR